ncbi:MAG TPA: histidinol-phosphatase [Chitinophagales bacterium]|nr:histidinol-phosphatase [Chitinophagales bacterium]HRK27219.1 histidinol-phosphatase [Chitinophagales bacterium]
MFWTNYHQHCYFCDGTDEPSLYVESAIEKGVKSFGFSSHAPMSLPVPWAVKAERFNEYLQTITGLKERYKNQLPIYVGLEIDYIPGITSPAREDFKVLDYNIGSVHYGHKHPDEGWYWEIDGTQQAYDRGIAEIYGGDVKKAVGSYFALQQEMLTLAPPQVLGHMDKVKMNNQNRHFTEDESWYKQLVFDTLEVAAASGVIIEVNTRGVYKKKTQYPYPSPFVLQRIKELNIPIVLNSDAHHPREITAYFTEAAQMLQELGFKELQILTPQGWQPRPFTAEGIIEQ